MKKNEPMVEHGIFTQDTMEARLFHREIFDKTINVSRKDFCDYCAAPLPEDVYWAVDLVNGISFAYCDPICAEHAIQTNKGT
jgi:hypothetical protein